MVISWVLLRSSVFFAHARHIMLPYQIDIQNVVKITLPHPGHSNKTQTAVINVELTQCGPLVRLFWLY